MIVDLTIKPRPSPGTRGYIYDVFRGPFLIVSSRDPEYAACRYLAATGLRGTARFWREGKGCHDSSLDIQRGAKWSAIDTKNGVRAVRYRNHWRREAQEF